MTTQLILDRIVALSTVFLEVNMKESFEIGRHLSILYRYGRTHMDCRMSQYLIGSGQYSFLFYLYRNNGASQEMISCNLCVDKGTTTRAIQKLESLHLVERVKDSEDGRVNRVFLTEEGYALKDNLIAYAKEWEEILLQDFDEDEIASLKKVVLKMSDNATNYRQNMEAKVKDKDVE